MIKIENLVKAFGPKRAVDGISFAVERGEVLGFLGPNGAGKSTTMRMITGFMPPSAGRITVGTYDVLESPIEAKRSRKVCEPIALLMPALSLSMIGRGTPAGAMTPLQVGAS